MRIQKIIYLTSSHYADDDRIYYHFRETLKENNFHFKVCSTYGISKNTELIDVDQVDGNTLTKREKNNWFYKQLIRFNPDVIICGEPLPILASKRFSKENRSKIIYDVTEWYPSKKKLNHLPFIKKYIKGGAMYLLNVYASYFVDGFIVGEYHKKKLYDFLYPLKFKTIISYYPKTKFVSLQSKKVNKDKFVIGYSGKFSKEKGLHRVFELTEIIQKDNPNLKVVLSLIGKVYNKKDQVFFEGLKLKYSELSLEVIDMVPFESFSKKIIEFDVAVDLRDNDWENSRCLPIKIFHYNGCGIPVIYSDLIAIRKGYIESDFCKLIDPDQLTSGARFVQDFIEDTTKYNNASKKAVEVIKNDYVWERIEKKLLMIVEKLRSENK